MCKTLTGYITLAIRKPDTRLITLSIDDYNLTINEESARNVHADLTRILAEFDKE